MRILKIENFEFRNTWETRNVILCVRRNYRMNAEGGIKIVYAVAHENFCSILCYKKEKRNMISL